MMWKTPSGTRYSLYADTLKQTHLLIAGTTGSGKSVVINGIISTAILRSPASCRLILIDPKRVELSRYRHLPHTIRYATEPDTVRQTLYDTQTLIDRRYRYMARHGQRMYTGSDIYLIIDEMADLMTTDKKHVQPAIQRIAQIGRAARIHIIAATQTPISAVIPTQIKVNFDSRLALRTRSAQDSRNILGVTGCECLPKYGQGYYMTPDEFTLYSIPMISEDEIHRLTKHWKKQNNILRRISL